MKLLKIVFFVLIGSSAFQALGQGFERPSIEERVNNEKKRVLEKVNDMTEDQRLIFDQIYVEYSEALEKTFSASAGNFQGMREKMQVIEFQ